MKTSIKRENDEFLVMYLKLVSGLMGPENGSGHQNFGQYLIKTATKRENDAFFLIPFKRVSGVTSHVNRPRTPKLWAIVQENGHQMRKRRVFGHNS
jgi:hypothetical protein